MPDYLNPTSIKKKRLEEMIQAHKVIFTIRHKTTNQILVLKQSSVSFSFNIKCKRSNSDISAPGKKMRNGRAISFRTLTNPQQWLGISLASMTSSQNMFQFPCGGLECDLSADCMDDHTPITKMNASEEMLLLWESKRTRLSSWTWASKAMQPSWPN